MNPSTKELLDVITQLEADQVLLLPNNSNIILTARQVKQLSRKRVGVVPTKTIPQGIAALLSFNNRADLSINVRRMSEVCSQVQTLALTKATRATTANGLTVKVGDVLGLYDEEIISVGPDYNDVALAALIKVTQADCEIITVYRGQDSLQNQAERLVADLVERFPEMEVELYYGGQPHYHYIISLE
jgi:dihydroxyacetone kinase-like predicted kinase